MMLKPSLIISHFLTFLRGIFLTFCSLFSHSGMLGLSTLINFSQEQGPGP